MIAVKLARKGGMRNCTGLELAVGLPKSYIKIQINEWTLRQNTRN